MKNKYYLLAGIFMLATLPLLADNSPVDSEEIALEVQETAQYGNRRTAPLGTKQEDGRKCRKEKDMLVVPEEQAIAMQKGMITPTVYPYVSNGSNSYATVDFIWWKTVIGGTGYAISGVSDGGIHVPFATDVSSGTFKRPDFGFQPGVKVGLGTHFDHDGWDIGAEYTFLSGSEEENRVTAAPGRGVVVTLPVLTSDGVGAPISVDEAECEWDQDFNVVDLELGRNFFISRFLTLRPHMGLKTAWIHETSSFSLIPTIGLTDPRDAIFSANDVMNVYIRENQNMWGLGLRGGMDTKWHFTKNWALYGDLDVTTFWADFHVKSRQVLTEAVDGTFTSAKFSYSVQAVIPVIEAGIGLSYIDWFCDNSYRIEVQAGWEQQVWLDFNYYQQQGFGSLSTQGLTFKVGLTF